jgi:hypothetical protein
LELLDASSEDARPYSRYAIPLYFAGMGASASALSLVWPLGEAMVRLIRSRIGLWVTLSGAGEDGSPTGFPIRATITLEENEGDAPDILLS